jgi:glycosyltransferase involved in cell wall biosynthesis
MKKIALVHDYLLGIGGAERVLRVLHEMFSRAPIYTVVYDEKFVKGFFADCHNGHCPALVRGSFLQKLPLFLRKRYKYFSFLIPSAVERLDLSGFDIVISSCSAFCKGVITRPDTVHICYCHTPTRYLWDWSHSYSRVLEGEGVKGFFAKIFIHFLRLWDQQAARRVDYFVANSKHVAARIKKYYGKEAVVIYPPVEHLTSAAPLSPIRRGGNGGEVGKDYFLIVSQLRPHKQIDIAVEAFKKLGFPLIIIGEGSDGKRLCKLARGAKNIKFLGRLDDGAVNDYYKNCRAFIYPCEEDFGIAIAEAMLFGKPVLALREGGAAEIVIPGISGEFFDDPHPVVLADGILRLNQNYINYSPILIQKRAEKFSRERFEKEMFEFVEKCCKMYL